MLEQEREIWKQIMNPVFHSGNQEIQIAIQEKPARMDQEQLFRECVNLDPVFEAALAEEGFAQDASEWPEY